MRPGLPSADIERVRERLDAKTEQGLVDAFIQDLERESKS